MFSFTKCYSSW